MGRSRRELPMQQSLTDEYLVYGGSTAVGLYSLQFAKLAGFRPIAICSPHNFELVKSYGAEAVFDYKTPAETIKAIKELTGGGVTIGFDTVSGDPSTFSLQAFRSDAEGSLMLINAPPIDEVKNGVRLKSLNMFTLFGEVCLELFSPGVCATVADDSTSTLACRATCSPPMRSREDLAGS